VKRTNRSRKIKIGIYGGKVIVTAPERAHEAFLRDAVLRHKDWIERALIKHKKLTDGIIVPNKIVDRKEFTKKVEALTQTISKFVSAPHGVSFNKISVRKMRSRWGSCSKDGNISINLLLGHLPDTLLEYVIIHELCHLVHHNHSRAFWALVAEHLPDHKLRKSELRRYAHLLKTPDGIR